MKDYSDQDCAVQLPAVTKNPFEALEEKLSALYALTSEVCRLTDDKVVRLLGPTIAECGSGAKQPPSSDDFVSKMNSGIASMTGMLTTARAELCRL